MPPYQKVKRMSKSIGKFIMAPKDKIKFNNPTKKTIGPGLVSGILESKKEILEKIEISKIALENLQEYARSKGVPVEQVVANLVEQKFNPKFKKGLEI